MCDVIRGAEHVFVLLPDLALAKDWNARMSTLPEALLARRQEITFYSPAESMTVSKLGMAGHVWDDGDAKEGDHQPTRLLAEHFSNVLTLGRLELFTIALEALTDRVQNGSFSQGDAAYALMGLLHYRIDLDHSDTLFQALAKLSNDSDRLIERMVCMLPDPDSGPGPGPEPDCSDTSKKSNIFLALTKPDLYHTQLWDIEPLCQVAGVSNEYQTFILDSCRGVSIRWKGFPYMKYKRSYGFRKFVAEIVLRSGVAWSALGLSLIIKYAWEYNKQANSANPKTNAQARAIVAIFSGCVAIIAAFLLSQGAPSAVHPLYGGQVMQSAPWLVGFEGVLPRDKLEKLIFGNDDNRLTYNPSSTPYCERDDNERIGVELEWILQCPFLQHPRPTIPPGHRLFTLVDTGNLTVRVFSARRPPSVALICGREGAC